MKIQLNHPGHQKPFVMGKGYSKVGNNILREWNNDNFHYRKYISNKGYYVDAFSDLYPKQSELFFWGEWEGNSLFIPYPKDDFRLFPNGIHKLFHSTQMRGLQNTDPYIYGDNFKFCVCKQSGKLCSLVLDDLILFGTTFPSIGKFYIDTVFIVKEFKQSSSIQSNNGLGYTQVYKEATLEQLNEYLKYPQNLNNKRLYTGKTWFEDKEYFSFVPCKVGEQHSGFERFFILLDNPDFQLSRNPTGKSFMKKAILNSKELFKKILELCKEQSFSLGIKIEEPLIKNLL